MRGAKPGTVRRVLELLSAFTEYDRELSMSEIAQLSGASMDTVARYVADLVACDYLEQTAAGYQLGPAVLPLAFSASNASRIRLAGMRALWRLSDVTRLNANLGMEWREKVLYLGRAETPLWRSFRNNVGRVAPMHCTALGKVLLAFGQPREIPELLPQSTPRTAGTREELARELALILEQGFASDHAEWISDVKCLAMPVRDRTGQVVAAVSASGPSSEVDLESDSLLLAVRSAAFEIQSQLGFTS